MKRKIDEFYQKYSYLADYYGNKIFKESNIGMEKEDIKQEMRLRLFLALRSYAKRWAEYKRTGKMKPIPIEYYLKTTMINKSRDFIREINKADFVSMENHTHKNITHIDTLEITKTEITVGSQKLSELFEENTLQKRLMKMYFMFNFDLKPIFKVADKYVIAVPNVDKKPTKREKKVYIEEVVNEGLEKIRQYLEN